MTESEITDLIRSDQWIMDFLAAAEGIASVPTRDVDLVYFDPTDTAPETDWRYDELMKEKYPFAEWEIRNQARMHHVNNFEPLTSTEDGIAHWVETATCIAVKLKEGKLSYLFCYGTEDLFGMVVRPVPYFKTGGPVGVYQDRILKKQWKARWPSLTIIE